jgi:fatty-acyl-CoA synthase
MATDAAGAPLPDTAVSTAPLSPVSFLLRSGRVWADRPAVRFGAQTRTYAELLDRAERVAGALRALGVAAGDRVATLLANVPAMLELHFAVPGLGAVLVPMNTRLGRDELTYILDHSRPRCLVAHERSRALIEGVAARLEDPPHVVYVDAPPAAGDSFESAVGAGQPQALAVGEEDALLSINYTSGTTGSPKGVMYSHRGAYLHALGVIAEAGLSTRSRYLWSLPMFHCNGWAFTWAVTAAGSEHICLDGVDASEMWRSLGEGATHLCAAPTVLVMLGESPEAAPLPHPVQVFVGGAPPAPALLDRMGRLGFEITHLYGLTETYGPLCVCAWQPSWDRLPEDDRAAHRARQGVGTVVSERLRVVDEDLVDVPADGQTTGEVVMRGNNVMLGYYRDPAATARAFHGGWFHSGDIGVMHPDGYLELRDRAKDIIISGGENISTIEIEQVLAAHPDVLEAAVVGVPDDKWGEVPQAFVVARAGAQPSDAALQDFVRARLARFKAPKRIVFCQELPKTATGKVQKYLLRP